jgi:hypothetical protein
MMVRDVRELGKVVEGELWGHQPISSGWGISPVVPLEI